VGEHGRSFELPSFVNRHGFRHALDTFLKRLCAAKGLRIDHGEDLGKHLDATIEGLLQKLLLGDDELMLVQRGVQGQTKHLRCTRLAEEAEDVALIDSFGSGVLVGVAGEHEADDIRRAELGLDEKLHTVHVRHVHVRHDHRVVVAAFECRQALLWTEGSFDDVFLSKLPLDGGQDVRIIVDEKDLLHKLWIGEIAGWFEVILCSFEDVRARLGDDLQGRVPRGIVYRPEPVRRHRIQAVLRAESCWPHERP
jgi:hypothetical protein